jgi:hypothetical protein
MDKHENPHIAEPMSIARAKRDRSGSSGPKKCLGGKAIGIFIFQPQEAAPSAAQEEDRSDIEDADHHDPSNLHRAIPDWQWSVRPRHYPVR